MGLKEMFIDDMNTLKNFSNTKIKVYENKVTGEYAYEVEQPKNDYVPERTRFYSKSKKASASGLLAPVLTVAGFWILIKYVLIGGTLSTLILFGNPLFWVALILIYVGFSR